MGIFQSLFARFSRAILIVIFSYFSLVGQQLEDIPLTTDETQAEKADTIARTLEDSLYNYKTPEELEKSRKARTAAIWSLLPGGGQIYNKQYYKAPLFAGGVTALGIYAIQSRSKYRTYHKEYTSILNGFALGQNSEADLEEIRNKKRSALVRSNLLTNATILLYGINILDAYTSYFLKKESHKHSPLRAAYYSALVPGLGQIYNKRYWKIPIAYAGIGVAGGFITFNYRLRKKYTNEYLARNRPGYGSTDPSLSYLPDDALLARRNFYKKNLDLSIIVGCLWYAIVILDATVDAHLNDFDVSDDLSFNISPIFVPKTAYSPTYGGLSLGFKF